MSVRGTRIVRCPGCGLATWGWRGFDFEAFYDADYWKSSVAGKGYADYFSLADAMAVTHGKRLRRLRQRLARDDRSAQPGVKLLDAGCGPGFFVKAAAEHGFAAAGVEISQFAARFAHEQLGVNVWPGQVKAGDLRGGPYEVITLWDVIEHLPDPANAVAAIYGALADGGLLVLSTGDISTLTAKLSGRRWHLFNLPEHLWFFSRESLRRMLKQAGFEVLECRYEVCWYPIRYLVERLEATIGSRGIASQRLGALGRICLPVTLRDIVTILARKPANR